MSFILVVLGIVVAAAGIAAACFGVIGFGIPGNELNLGATLIIAGSTAFTGGLLLIGLGVLVNEVGRLADGLRTRPVATRPAARPAEAASDALPAGPPAAAAAAPSLSGRPPHAQVPASPRHRPAEAPLREARTPDSAPAAPSAVEVSAAAIERLRSSIPRTEQRPRAEISAASEPDDAPLSPNGAAHAAPRPPAVDTSLPESRAPAEDRAATEGPVEALKASRLDFLFRARPAARPAPQGENFDAFWPSDPRAARSAEAPPRADEVQRQEYAPPAEDRPAPERRAEFAPAEPAAILKSGVVDGMAYTLYADGSIEARLPHGTVRFGSIAELRAHIESNS